jgi:hypothetical protein
MHSRQPILSDRLRTIGVLRRLVLRAAAIPRVEILARRQLKGKEELT